MLNANLGTSVLTKELEPYLPRLNYILSETKQNDSGKRIPGSTDKEKELGPITTPKPSTENLEEQQDAEKQVAEEAFPDDKELQYNRNSFYEVRRSIF